MVSRVEFSTKTRRDANERAGGVCEWTDGGFRCQSVLGPGNREFDHIIPFAISRDSSLENAAVLCRAHHALKTATQDQPWIAKTRHQRDAHTGARQPAGNIHSPGFAKAERPPKRVREDKRCAGPTGFARRFGMREDA